MESTPVDPRAALANRLNKRFRHLRKWARRSGVSCWRVYERDIPEFPLVVDWYDGDVVAWVHPRKKDETPEQEESFVARCVAETLAAFQITREHLFVKRRQRQRGSDQYERLAQQGVTRIVDEDGLRFEVNLSDFLDTGLFLDHRLARRMIRERAAGKRVLNLFAYTGAFTVHAVAGGAAQTLTVDMSRTYQDWTRRNLALNDIPEGAAHRLVQDDCLSLLERGPERGEAFDLVICDPPTFSNSKRMGERTFSVDRDWRELLADISPWIAPAGQILFSTNSRSFEFAAAGLPAGFAAQDVTAQTTSEDVADSHGHRAWMLARPSAAG